MYEEFDNYEDMEDDFNDERYGPDDDDFDDDDYDDDEYDDDFDDYEDDFYEDHEYDDDFDDEEVAGNDWADKYQGPN
jgi:DNA-directed RNA polymerase subunit delta